MTYGPEVAKHRTSLAQSTDVLHQKYGCFRRRSPMFLFSGKVLRRIQVPYKPIRLVCVNRSKKRQFNFELPLEFLQNTTPSEKVNLF